MLNLPNRTFWREQENFTHFIIANFAVLSALIGFPFVHSERARRKLQKAISDLVGRNGTTGSVVVIELQVAPADDDHWHRLQHYARSHGADIVIWIAESFDEKIVKLVLEHNRRRGAPFRVFAIACRVLAALPLAPYFDVIVRPENKAGSALGLPDVLPCVGELHSSAGLWATLLILHPDEIRRSHQRTQHIRIRRKRVAGWRVWCGVFEGEIHIWLSPQKWWSVGPHLDLRPHAGLLESRLGVSLVCEETGRFALKRRAVSAEDARDWSTAAVWLYEQANAYEAALRDCTLQL